VEQVGASQAIEKFIHEYGKLVFHLIYSLTGEWEESQDLTQDTFLSALQAIDTARRVRGEAFHAKAWLMRIAVNTARMYLRRRRLIRFSSLSQLALGQEGESESWHKAMAPAQPAGYATTETADPAESLPERAVVAHALARMPESLRLPLLLSTVAGFSTAEVATQLELNEAAVRQRLSRAKRAFQQLYTLESCEVARSDIGSPVQGKAKQLAGPISHQRIRYALKPSLASQGSRQLPATA
jgi:RNA polymerase sigma-70 factor (ECF subfamily)